VLAQRLVRKLCPDCRRPVQAQGSVSALLGFDSGAIVFAPMGCESCEGTGFAGSTGVFEAIVADGAIRRLINDGGDEAILARHAFLRAPNLGSAARALVREGLTTPEEAVRISRG
jgi:general secretion pathway protein E